MDSSAFLFQHSSHQNIRIA